MTPTLGLTLSHAETGSAESGRHAIRPARPSRLSARRADQRAYRALSALAFVAFLAPAVLARFMPAGWRARFFGLAGKPGIIEDARAMAATSVPFAFMA